jgi:type IV pilus biogenesis protein CpaD/CtpE
MLDSDKLFRSARLAAVLPVFVLAGCNAEMSQDNPIDIVTAHTFDSANWQQGTSKIETQVEPITLVHLLSFGPGDTSLSAQEIADLREFLQKSGVHDGARIEVDGPRVSGGYFDPLTKGRVEEIRAELSSLGLRSQIPAKQLTLLARPPEGIAVTVTRAMIIPPDCSVPQPEFATRPDSTWSCANAANLGRMINDPVDLVRGQTPSAADGETSAKAIELYRNREVEDPTAEKTSEK